MAWSFVVEVFFKRFYYRLNTAIDLKDLNKKGVSDEKKIQ